MKKTWYVQCIGQSVLFASKLLKQMTKLRNTFVITRTGIKFYEICNNFFMKKLIVATIVINTPRAKTCFEFISHNIGYL